MRPWCKDLPVVSVPNGGTPKRVTLVMPYYENPGFFLVQCKGWWEAAPIGVREHVRAIVVDDGSPVPMPTPPATPFPLSLYRIEVDVRWNWLAARNIGAHHADDGWLLLTDMDHVVPAETFRSVVYGQHDPHVVYAFSRRERTGEVIWPHSASFLMTRQMFWTIGGYDERLSGHYGTDGIYRRRLMATAPVKVLTDALVRYEYVLDSSTARYGRKEAQDKRVQTIAQTLPVGSKPKTLSFPYHQVSV